MNLEQLLDTVPSYAKDLKLNLSNLLQQPDLSKQQIWGSALTSAITSRNPQLLNAITTAAAEHLKPEAMDAARAAAAIMGMNNIYYRFLHLVEDAEYQSMPARLRMNVIGNPGIDKLDFELLSLAVSAVNGCGLCIISHERKLRDHGVTRETIQSAVRIAAVIHAVAGVLESTH